MCIRDRGKDYKILSQSGRSITIEALDEEGCLPYINAKVQQPSAVASTAAVTTSGAAAVPPATKRETEAQAQMRTEKQTEKAPQMEAGSTKAATEAVDGKKESTAKGSRPVLPLAAPVSYTHLDVYKRQPKGSSTARLLSSA